MTTSRADLLRLIWGFRPRVGRIGRVGRMGFQADFAGSGKIRPVSENRVKSESLSLRQFKLFTSKYALYL